MKHFTSPNLTSFDAAEGPCLAMTTSACYRLRHGKTPERRSATAEPPPEVAECDAFAAARVDTDVLVLGTAYSGDEPSPCFDTHLELGPVRKTVRVFGARVVEDVSHGRPVLSPAEPIRRVTLGWAHAYGGRDREAERAERRASPAGFGPRGREPQGALSYPRNRFGRGYLTGGGAERLRGLALPHFEDPDDPITPERIVPAPFLSWLDLPVAAGYGPIDPWTYPRSAYVFRPAASPPSRPVREVVMGALTPEDLAPQETLQLDARALRCAPAGQNARLRGGEALRLVGLHPSVTDLRTSLPTEAPRMFLDLSGVERRELSVSLKTVLIEPDDERLTLTWTGRLSVLFPFTPEQTATVQPTLLW